jgi:serine/threonine-protein kinase SMG1
MLFSPSSEFLKIRFWKNERVHKGLIKIYHEILNIKNVLLLQEAYKHILKDIEKALRSLVGMQEISDILCQQRHEQMAEDKEEEEADTSDVYTELQAEIVLNFDFSALSALATTNGQIMAMWALQPSLLELLAHKMRLADIRLWHNRYQIIHFAFLKLLSSHCMINNNFITSSVLLNTKNSKMAEVFNKLSMLSPSQSPTSEHFGLIMVFLCEILKNDRELTTAGSLVDRNSNTTTVTILLDWCNDLFSHIAQYAEILKTKPEFTAIVKRINAISINAANNSYTKTTLKCAICLDTLLSTFETLHVDCYTSIADICCVLMCSVNFELREKYSFLFAMLPLKYSLKQVNEFSGRNESRAGNILQLQQWHVSSDMGGTLRPQYFKAFIEKIQFSKDAEHVEEYLKEIFPKCWYVDPLAPKSVEYMEMAGRDIRCLISWIQWETAQFCVNNKLRTPIGKLTIIGF